MSTTLTGPAGGEWVLVDGSGRDVPARCDLCAALVAKSYRYYVGIVSHATVCLACADLTPITPTKEATMAPTTSDGSAGITPAILAEIALALEGSNLDWEEGRATSPDTRDFVLIAERVITDRIGPEYLWLSDATGESVAEAMYELQCDGKLSEWAEMAEWLSGMVTVGPDATDYPSGERS